MSQAQQFPRNKTRKVLSRRDIETAMKASQSNAQAARFLGVNKITYKKYATQYIDEATGKTLYDLGCNKYATGIKRGKRKVEAQLIDILEGKLNPLAMSLKNIKYHLIKEGYLASKCNACGYDHHRSLDGKVPLLLSYRDGNKKNLRLENLMLLCYNCYFHHVGDLYEESQEQVLEDFRKKHCKAIDFEIEDEIKDKFNAVVNPENKIVSTEIDLTDLFAGESREHLEDEDYGSEFISTRTKKKDR